MRAILNVMSTFWIMRKIGSIINFTALCNLIAMSALYNIFFYISFEMRTSESDNEEKFDISH